jgi:hypothetical protein
MHIIKIIYKGCGTIPTEANTLQHRCDILVQCYCKVVACLGTVICGLLGNYTASCGNYLPTFRDVSVPSSWVKIGTSRGPLPRLAAKFPFHKLSFHLGILIHEDGTDTMSRNVGK